MYELKSTK